MKRLWSMISLSIGLFLLLAVDTTADTRSKPPAKPPVKAAQARPVQARPTQAPTTRTLPKNQSPATKPSTSVSAPKTETSRARITPQAPLAQRRTENTLLQKPIVPTGSATPKASPPIVPKGWKPDAKQPTTEQAKKLDVIAQQQSAEQAKKLATVAAKQKSAPRLGIISKPVTPITRAVDVSHMLALRMARPDATKDITVPSFANQAASGSRLRDVLSQNSLSYARTNLPSNGKDLRQPLTNLGRDVLAQRGQLLRDTLNSRTVDLLRQQGTRLGESDLFPPDKMKGPPQEFGKDPLHDIGQQTNIRTAINQSLNQSWEQNLPGFTRLQLNAGGRRSDPRSSSNDGGGHGGVKDVEVVNNNGTGDATVITTYNDGTKTIEQEVKGGEAVNTTTIRQNSDGSTTTTNANSAGSITHTSQNREGATFDTYQTNSKDGVNWGYNFIRTDDGQILVERWRGESREAGMHNETYRIGMVEDGKFYWDSRKYPSPHNEDRFAGGTPTFNREEALNRLQLRTEGRGQVDASRVLTRGTLLSRNSNPVRDGPTRDIGPLPPPVNPVADPPDENVQPDGAGWRPDRRLLPPKGIK